MFASSEIWRFNAPVLTCQILTGSAKDWFTLEAHVASVSLSRLSATEVIGRSPAIVPARDNHGRKVWIRRPVVSAYLG
jgi:hypothetical protein